METIDHAVEHIDVTAEALQGYRDAQNRLHEANTYAARAYTYSAIDAEAAAAWSSSLRTPQRAVYAAYLVAFEGRTQEDAEVMVALGYQPSDKALSEASRIASMYFAELRAGAPRLPLRVARPRHAG